jgi:hypothetical protein
MAVNLHLLTNAKNKRQRRAGQIEEYFKSLVTDLTTSSDRDLSCLAIYSSGGFKLVETATLYCLK